MLKFQTSEKPRPAFRALAVFLALSVWMLGLLAASPELHSALHADADHADHTCAVTLFSHGVEGPVASLHVSVAPFVFVSNLPVAVEIIPAAAPRYWLLPGRAPPIC